MANNDHAFLVIVGICLMALIGYRVMGNHAKLGYIMMLPIRFIPLLPFVAGTVPEGGFAISELILMPAWFFMFAFELKHNFWYAIGCAIPGVILHSYGA